jgi:hypothetical protein
MALRLTGSSGVSVLPLFILNTLTHTPKGSPTHILQPTTVTLLRSRLSLLRISNPFTPPIMPNILSLSSLSTFPSPPMSIQTLYLLTDTHQTLIRYSPLSHPLTRLDRINPSSTTISRFLCHITILFHPLLLTIIGPPNPTSKSLRSLLLLSRLSSTDIESRRGPITNNSLDPSLPPRRIHPFTTRSAASLSPSKSPLHRELRPKPTTPTHPNLHMPLPSSRQLLPISLLHPAFRTPFLRITSTLIPTPTPKTYLPTKTPMNTLETSRLHLLHPPTLISSSSRRTPPTSHQSNHNLLNLIPDP